MKVVAAACDGACSGNPGPGGWGALLRYSDGSVQEFGAADAATTNNRMELTAALVLLETLATLPRDSDLVIRTDSKYLIDGFSKWINGWKRKGWRTASGGAVLNRDLWERLDQARLADVPLRYVKGHSGDPDNDRCDAIAVAFSRGQRPALAGGAGQAAVDAGARAAVIPTAQEVAPSGDAPPASEAPDDPAPLPLQRLLSRLELADRFASGGHGLTVLELAQLVEQPLSRLERRSRAWTWRDWQVEPLADGRWRLRRDAPGLPERE